MMVPLTDPIDKIIFPRLLVMA